MHQAEQKAKDVFELESRRYLAEAGLLRNLDLKYSTAVAAYILCSSMALPVKTVIVGERPYSADIHPAVSSAMSYDSSKTRPTPSTTGIAMDVSRVTGSKYVEVERWFRDSWAYLSSGTVVVNCTLFSGYSSSYSANETVPFQRWLRSIIECSAVISESKIDIVCMGVPSLNVVNSMLQSMGKLRSITNKKTYPNPAIWGKLNKGDERSRTYTFGKKSTSLSILAAIERSRNHTPLTFADYISHMSQTPVKQVPQVDRLLRRARTFVDEAEDAYKELESNHKMPSLRDAYEELARSLVEYRDAVLYDLVSASVAASGDSSSKVGKSTEWGSKKPWNKPPASVGNSSKMSVVTEEAAGVEQKFEDYGGDPVTILEESADPELAAEPAEPKPRKKKMVKRMVKRPKAPKSEATEGSSQGTDTIQGAKLTEANASALRYVVYYVSDIGTDSASVLKNDISATLNSGIIKTTDIGTIIDTIARDTADTGKDASVILGLDDGVVSEECILPKLLKKLTEG